MVFPAFFSALAEYCGSSLAFREWRFIRGEGLILRNPLTRGRLCGGHKGIKPESNTFREQHTLRLCCGVVD
jgi:hypothetical protein